MSITIYDIAKKANVSSMTVSRVINGSGPVAPKTAEKIKKIIEKHNYHPNLIARSLSSRRTKTIGVIIHQTEKVFLDNYIAQVLSGVSDVARQNDYRIMLLPVRKSVTDKYSYVNMVKSRLFDGLVLLKTSLNDHALPNLAESGFPYVLVNYRTNKHSYNFVDAENIKGAELAMDYLYEKGHRKIAFVKGSMNETNAVDRFIGYKKQLKKYKIPFRDELVIQGDFTRDTAYKNAAEILKLKNKPTAVFCSDDYMALGVIERIKSAGLSVPEDIAVVGFDDIEIGEFTRPTLTTIKQPMYEIGKSAFEALTVLISKKHKAPVSIMLKTELIKRESA
jgi:LacI family transcriptional regulator